MRLCPSKHHNSAQTAHQTRQEEKKKIQGQTRSPEVSTVIEEEQKWASPPANDTHLGSCHGSASGQALELNCLAPHTSALPDLVSSHPTAQNLVSLIDSFGPHPLMTTRYPRLGCARFWVLAPTHTHTYEHPPSPSIHNSFGRGIGRTRTLRTSAPPLPSSSPPLIIIACLFPSRSLRRQRRLPQNCGSQA